MIRSVVILGLSICSGLAYSAPPIVGGYATWWRSVAETKAIPVDKYTHVFHAFVTADADGQLVERQGNVPATWFPEWAHEGGAKALLSVGGGAYHGFAGVANDGEARQRLVRELIAAVETHGYDGLDIDWEFPRNRTEGANWKLLMTELRAALSASAEASDREAPYLLTAAVGGSKWGGRHIDPETIRTKLDFINVMTYDYSGPWGGIVGPHAALTSTKKDAPSVEASMHYWLGRGVPKSQLVVGLPFYSYVFHGVEAGDKLSTGHKKHVTSMGWRQLEEMLHREKWTRTRDQKHAVVVCASADGQRITSIDDPRVIETKTRWASKNGFSGVFVWALGHEEAHRGNTPLTDAIHRGLPAGPQEKNQKK